MYLNELEAGNNLTYKIVFMYLRLSYYFFQELSNGCRYPLLWSNPVIITVYKGEYIIYIFIKHFKAFILFLIVNI